MPPLHLKRFYDDAELREAVLEYFINHFSKKAIEKVFAREEVTHLADAKDMIEDAINELDIMFEKPQIKKSTNEAV